MELPDEQEENKSGVPLPCLAKAIVISEGFLNYLVTSSDFILRNIAFIKIHEYQEVVITDQGNKRALGALLSVVPAWLADSYVGKFWVFLTAYMVMSLWPVCLTMLFSDGMTGVFKLYSYDFASLFTSIYFCVEPVRFVLLTEQLELPQQEENLPLYISLLFLSRNIVSTVTTFWLGSERNNNDFLFGHSLMLVAFMISYNFFFTFVKKKLKSEGPVHFIYSGGIKCILTALIQRINSFRGKGSKKKGFLDYAAKKCDVFFIYNCKMYSKLTVFTALAIFAGITEFYLVDVTSHQEKRLVPLEFLPENYSVADIQYPVGIVWFIIWNLFTLAVLRHFRISIQPLRLYGMGFVLSGLALIFACVIQIFIAKTGTLIPSQGFGQVRFFNALPTVVAIKSRIISNDSSEWIYLTPRGMWAVTGSIVSGTKEGSITYSYTAINEENTLKTTNITVIEEESLSYVFTKGELIRIHDFDPLASGPPGMNDPRNPRVYVICGMSFCYGKLSFINKKMTRKYLVPNETCYTSLFTLPVGYYNVTLLRGERSYYILTNIEIKFGGVYAVLLYTIENKRGGASVFSVVEPNKLSAALLLPQIILSTFSYLVFRIYGFIVLYTQAPPKLRCTTWILAPYELAAASFLLWIDQRYWHHTISIPQMTTVILAHFAATFVFVYFSIIYEPQYWCSEGAVFQDYPPLATRVKAQYRTVRKMSSRASTVSKQASNQQERVD